MQASIGAAIARARSTLGAIETLANRIAADLDPLGAAGR